MRMKKYFFIVILCGFTNSLDAQDLLNQLGKLGKKEGAKKTAQSNASLDSADFQFTISVNENASFFDVKQKGEDTNKAMNFFFSEENKKTSVDYARDTLKQGINLYEVWKRYEAAEL